MNDQLSGLATADLVMGVVLLVIGLRCGRRALPPSLLLGIPVPSAMRSTDAWYAGHEAAAAPLVQGAALGVLGSVGGLVATPAWGVVVVAVAFAAVLGHVFAAVVACERAAKLVAPGRGLDGDADLDA